jgi:arsenate reductase (glutaredoxin)
MMNLKVYHYTKCGTCRSAVKWLQSRGFTLELHDIFEQAPARETVAQWVALSGLPVKKFFNVSGEVYKEMQLKDRIGQMSEAEMIDLLASNGRLIKRPVVTDGKRVTVGYKEEDFNQVWGAGRDE